MNSNDSPQNPELQDKSSQAHINKGFFSRIRTYFLTGLLVTGPILITLYIAWVIVTAVDNTVISMIPLRYNPQNLVDFYIPGFGLILVVLVLIFVGMFAANFMGRFFVGLSDKIIKKMPFIRGIYSATKQIMETVFAAQSEAFREVVLVEYPRRGMWVIGFVTAKTGGEIQNASEAELLNIFVPTTPNPTSGFLVFVPKEDAYKVNMTVEEGLKMVISGGIITPPDKRSVEEKKIPPYIRSREITKDI